MKRNYNLDILRIIAATLVVLFHCVVSNWLSEPIDSFNWNIMNVIVSICYCCDPLFVMLSGALILSKDITFRNLYKRIKRFVIVFVIWSLFYYLTEYEYDGLLNIIELLLEGKYHMWYLYMIIGLYILSPVFRKVTENRKLELYTILVIVMFSCLMPNLLNIFGLFDLSIGGLSYALDNIQIGKISIYFAYYLIGHYITAYNIKNKKTIFLCAIICLLISIIGTQILSNKFNISTNVLNGDKTVLTMIISIGIFVLVYSYKKDYKKTNIITKLSQLTFGVYLIHPFCIDILLKIRISDLFNNALALIIVRFIIVYLSSLIISFILNAIPITKRILLQDKS